MKKVYHGTTMPGAKCILEKGILLSKSKEFTDFHKGFYVSEHFEYAKQTALHKAYRSKSFGRTVVPAVVELEYDDATGEKMSILKFSDETIEWLQFIVNNRNGIAYVNDINSDFHNLGLSYDIVCGRICDGQIFSLSENLRKQKRCVNLTDIKDVVYKNNPYATQISFHTPIALTTLKVMGIKEVKTYG